MRQHHVIYVPGLRDTSSFNKPFHELALWVWRQKRFYPHLYLPHWEEGKHFQPKLDALLSLIDELVEQKYIVSLAGQSAGGSAVLNAFSERRKVVNGAVNFTGRLRAGDNVSPTLEKAAKNSPAFKESVLSFERRNEASLGKRDRERIMTIRPKYDETVPSSTVAVPGATNLVAPIIEHSLGGGFISTFYSGRFLQFLDDLAKKSKR